MPADVSFDLLSFGETMIRLAAPRGTRLADAYTLDLTIGGTESNVAVALAQLGRRVAWVSALVDNPLGRRIERELRSREVDTSLVRWSSIGRVGVYFLDPGVHPRPTRVYYDRAESAVARLEPGSIDPAIVERARALHLTGITPALSPGCAAICEHLAHAARMADVPLVFDVNYRARLWTPLEARSAIDRLADGARLLFCGVGDAQTIWEVEGQPDEIASQLQERFDAETVVVTAGAGGATAIGRDGHAVHQDAIGATIVDPVGAGDAFAAGFIDRWLDDRDDVAAALRSGVALAALKMTVAGDHASFEAAELAEALELLDRPGVDIVR